MIHGEVEHQPVDLLARHPGPDLAVEHVEALGGKPSRPAHALEGSRAMQLDLSGFALRRQDRVNVAHVGCGGEVCGRAVSWRPGAADRNVSKEAREASITNARYSLMGTASATSIPSWVTRQRRAIVSTPADRARSKARP